MAGIRGVKNPYPKKESTASGLFKQRGSGPAIDASCRSAAMASDRVDPTSRNNKLPANKSGVRSNPALKRGTSERS